MNVFLTGEVQVGKSMAIRRYLSAQPPRVLGGFRTVSLPDAAGRLAVYIAPYAGPVTADAAHCVGLRGGTARPEGFPAVFDSAGVALLRLPEGCELVLMDEIGFMENNAPLFRAALLALLDGSVPVLGVAKTRERHTPLLDAVRAHPKSVLLDVTRENRDAIPAEIARLLG